MNRPKSCLSQKVALSVRVLIAAFVGFEVSPAGALIIARDRRVEVESRADISQRAAAIAMWLSPVYTEKNSDGSLQLKFAPMTSVSNSYGVCAEERFSNQPTNPVACTGFLISPTLLVTAGHCMVNYGEVSNAVTPQCSDFGWLFDYRVDSRRIGINGSAGVNLTHVARSRVARCKRVIKAEFTYLVNPITKTTIFENDYALIELDQPASGRQPLALETKSVQVGDRVSMIGYGFGLPAKYSSGGQVIESRYPEYFRTDLGALGGDSGAPVMNENAKVVGILVRAFPDADLVDQKLRHCSTLNTCDSTRAGAHCDQNQSHYAIGSEIQRIDKILALVSSAHMTSSAQ